MAEMLIDGVKLDACLDAEADAIRAKTGDSNDLTFDFANNKGFADAIAAIPSGGGELLVDNVATEDVATINLVIPEGKKSYRIYVVELVGETSASEWVYPQLNTTTPGTNGIYMPQKQTYNSKFVVAKYAYGAGGFAVTIGGGGSSSITGINSPTLDNILLNLYYASSVFKVGFEAKVWGYDI